MKQQGLHGSGRFAGGHRHDHQKVQVGRVLLDVDLHVASSLEFTSFSYHPTVDTKGGALALE